MYVSRAVSNIDLVAPYYIDILKGTEVHEEAFDDGTRLKIVNAPGSTVHLQFWEGVATGFQIKIDMKWLDNILRWKWMVSWRFGDLYQQCS